MIENDSVRENQKNRTHKLAFFCFLFTEQTCKGGLLDSASIPSQFEDAALPQETLSEADFVLKAQFLMTVEIKTEQRDRIEIVLIQRHTKSEAPSLA